MLDMGALNDRLKCYWVPVIKNGLRATLRAEIINAAKANEQIDIAIVEAYNALAENGEENHE